jgi:hypothetical protein
MGLSRRPPPACAMRAPVAEYLEVMRKTTLDDARHLNVDLGIPWRSIAATCPAPTRITRSSARLYRPDQNGSIAWIIPVCCVDLGCPEDIEALDPIGVVSVGQVLDLVAFDPRHPRRFALRSGSGVVLGAIAPQIADPQPVRIFPDITDWLRNECDGLVILTDDRHQAGRILRCIAKIEPEDDQHAVALRGLSKLPPFNTPIITTSRERIVA